MRYWILPFVYLLMFVGETRSITCIDCTSFNNSACADPFNSAGGNFVSVVNQTYCRKSVGVTGIIVRSATNEMCITAADIGVTSVYCCSDSDFCNEGTRHHHCIITSLFFIFSFYFLSK
ncbi:hypothetical protein I4U23_006073 [Adineta vaga]|nr:hypothetical protein I4U23_006073 [Adineta vaga]